MPLLQIYSWVWWLKDFENLSAFCEITGKRVERQIFWLVVADVLVVGRPLQVTVHPVLWNRCLSCMSVALVYCGKTVRWIRMPLCTVGLGPGDILLDGDPASPSPPIERGTAALPHFSADIYCAETVAHLNCCWVLVRPPCSLMVLLPYFTLPSWCADL